MEGRKDDANKPPLGLVPREAMEGLARVLEYGAKKYTKLNWRKGMRWSRVYDAALRHLYAFIGGEDRDPESGLPHLDHAQACLAFLSTYQAAGIGQDDRKDETEEPAAKEPEIRVGQSWRDKQNPSYFIRIAKILDDEYAIVVDAQGERRATLGALRRYYTLVDTTLEPR